jgi:hypothetical protein
VLVAAALAFVLAGCGGVRAADLFLVTRTSSSPASRLTIVVNEEGGVTCNGAARGKISDSQLLTASGIKEDLQHAASEGVYLAPRPGSVYAYFLRDENGTVRFSDNSPGATKPMHQLALLVLQVAQQLCHVPQ